MKWRGRVANSILALSVGCERVRDPGSIGLERVVRLSPREALKKLKPRRPAKTHAGADPLRS